MPTINGALYPITAGTTMSYDPSRGSVRVTKYKSAGDNLGGMASDCIANRIPFEYSFSGTSSEITITESDGVASDNWQLLANEIQRDIKDHPRVFSIPRERKRKIYGQSEIANNGQDVDAIIVASFVGNELLLYNQLLRGVTHYAVGQYVIKHTANIPNIDGFGVGSIADIGIEKIYTTAQLTSEITDPVAWTNPCRGRILNKIRNIEIQEETSDDVMWGWRKLPAQETIAANNRVDVSYEYWLQAWSRLLYEPIS